MNGSDKINLTLNILFPLGWTFLSNLTRTWDSNSCMLSIYPQSHMNVPWILMAAASQSYQNSEPHFIMDCHWPYGTYAYLGDSIDFACLLRYGCCWSTEETKRSIDTVHLFSAWIYINIFQSVLVLNRQRRDKVCFIPVKVKV